MSHRRVLPRFAAVVMIAGGLLAVGARALALQSSASLASSDNPLRGVIDFHCHTGPDVMARSVSDLEAARIARRAGMRGLVLKNHFAGTAARAELARREVPGLEVFGGLTLNRAVGGLNAEAVRRMTQVEGQRGKVVWLPTFDAENHIRHAKENRPGVTVVREGKVVPELNEILQLIAEHQLVLATGHSSAEESLVIMAAARRVGVRRMLVTHAMADPINATVAQMKRMTELGAVIECVFGTHIAGDHAIAPALKGQTRVTIVDYARAIKSLGAEHFLIASDLGQYLNPLHHDGLRAFMLGLRDEGLSERDLDRVARQNPAKLLGLR